MDDQDSDFEAARTLEDIRFIQWVSDASVRTNEQLLASERDLAVQGLAQSGPRYKVEINIIFISIEDVVEKTIAYREQLCAKVPALLESGNLKMLKEKLDRYVDSGIERIIQRVTISFSGPVLAALTREAEQRAKAVKTRLNQKLAALPLEARLGVHQAGEPRMTTFNISNSTIANLNLGSVVGDLNSSIQQLSTAGQAELAETIRKLTEAIGATQDLTDDSRKEMLEHLSVLSEESAKPPEQRKMGPVKSSLVALRSGLGVAAQLFSVYQGLEHALKAAGVIH
jgi:hypothetical protein